MLFFAREILSLEMFEPDFVSDEVYKSFLLEVSSYLWVLQASLAQDEFVHCFDTIKSLSRSINNLMASCNSSGALVKMDVKSLCSTIMNRNDLIFDVLRNSMSSKTRDFLKGNSEDLRNTLCIDLLENARLEDLTDQNRYRMPWEKFKNESVNMTQKQVSLENEIVNLKEEVTLNQKQSRVKEELLQQAQVKIELLEKKMDIARKESAVVDKYEAMYEKWKNQEAVYKEALDKLQNTVETLKQQNQASLADKGSPKKGSTPNVSSSSEKNNVSSSKLDILLRHSAKSRQNQVWSNFLREFTEPDPLTEFSKANLSRPKENLFIKEAKTAAKVRS
jgi:chloramphenicol O-acetyltransferase